MAKGRPAKAKAQSGDDTKKETKKVSAADDSTFVGGDWGIVRMTGKEEATVCKSDDCEEVAVAVWATKTDADDEWPLCESCQEKEHGGWPDGFDRNAGDESSKPTTVATSTKDTLETPTDETEESGNTGMDVDSKETTPSKDEDAKMEDASNNDNDVKMTPTSEDKDAPMEEVDDTEQQDKKDSKEEGADMDEEVDDEDEEEEKWELKKILPHATVTDGAIKCGTDDCLLAACCLYISSTTGEKWYGCIDCQDAEFGGWPSTEELPVKSLDKDHIKALIDKCSQQKRPAMPPFETSNTPKQHEKASKEEGAAMDEEADEEEEKWALKKILTHAAVTNPDGAIKCGTDGCFLAACCQYVSSATGEKWYGCIDCQEAEFGGWPSIEELPVKSLDKDHIKALIDKCSKQKRPAMPPFESSNTPKRQKNQSDTNTVTPLNSATIGQASKGSKTTVTPTPAKAPAKDAKKAKQNATLMKRHAEWQQAAIKMGGPEARIVVKKDLAKPIIFELLYDAMKPMNITQIHTELKATVPSPILKSCLDEMALDNNENQFYDSDDEDDAPKKSKKTQSSGDQYAGSLVLRGGRNPNSTLYYVDHTKQKNNGNGLEPDQRNELANNLAQAQEEESMLKAQLKAMEKETTQLLSEPTNEEATAALERQEAEMTDIRQQLEEARALKVNEKHKKQTKKRIDSLVAQWRKRKRLCMDFLITMEESTEGTISAKKCLSGDGQIDIESDESAVKNAKEYGKKKRSMASRPVKKMKVSKGLGGKTTGLASKSESLTSGLTADPNFVAVRLNAAGQVERVYLGDDE